MKILSGWISRVGSLANRLRDEVAYEFAPRMTDQLLEDGGYELCEFGGDCEDCGREVPQKDYFFIRTSYEYIEGSYYCRVCATKNEIELSHLGEEEVEMGPS